MLSSRDCHLKLSYRDKIAKELKAMPNRDKWEGSASQKMKSISHRFSNRTSKEDQLFPCLLNLVMTGSNSHKISKREKFLLLLPIQSQTKIIIMISSFCFITGRSPPRSQQGILLIITRNNKYGHLRNLWQNNLTSQFRGVGVQFFEETYWISFHSSAQYSKNTD